MMDAPLRISVARAALATFVATVALLAIPLISMQFTTEVNWGPGDFMVAGALLFSAGMAYYFISRAVRTARQRLVVAALVVALVAIVWAELAVGIFD